MAERLRGQDMKEDWEWLAFAASLPASPVQFLGVSASKQLVTGRYIVAGCTGVNSGGATGTVTLYDGEDTTGEIIGVVTVAAGASFSIPLPANGVMSEIGVYMGLSTATVTGSATMVPLWVYNVTPPGQ